MFMYKYLGFGLLSLVAILMIPAEDVESISDAGMYGMAILTVRDSADNILFTNTVHNLIPDQATAQMLGNMFVDAGPIIGDGEALQANGICLTDSSGFAADNAVDSINFATTGGGGAGNSLDGAAGASCKVVTWTLTAQAATGALTNFAAGDVNVPDGTTITGFAVCDLETGTPNDFCDTGSNLVAAIDTSVTLGAGETVDITYILNLD